MEQTAPNAEYGITLVSFRYAYVWFAVIKLKSYPKNNFSLSRLNAFHHDAFFIKTGYQHYVFDFENRCKI